MKNKIKIFDLTLFKKKLKKKAIFLNCITYHEMITTKIVFLFSFDMSNETRKINDYSKEITCLELYFNDNIQILFLYCYTPDIIRLMKKEVVDK